MPTRGTTKKPAKPEPKPEPVKQQEPTETAPERTERQAVGVVERQGDDQPQQKRLSLPVGEDGTIAWDRMRGSNASEIKTALKADPVVQSLFASAAGLTQYTNDDAATALGLFVGVECFVFERILKIDSTITRQVFPYSSDEHERLDPLVASVLNKHASAIPTWVTKYRQEIVLAKTLMDITVDKIVAARQMQAQLIAAQQQQERQQRQQHQKRNGQAIQMETAAEIPAQ
jgi:hypothetical protein